MTALFIADLHLNMSEPAVVAGFVEFLRTEAREANALYILGDLFEFWIGDDDRSELATVVSTELNALAETGVQCYFVHGNRDFLLGKKFAQTCQITLLQTETTVTVGNQSAVILHGDTLCTDDESYQKFRRIVNQRWLQKLFLFLPLCLRRRIARQLRQQSNQSQQNKPAMITDVNPQAVIDVLQRHQVNIIIHGHTHKLDWHFVFFKGKEASRIVLGDWHTTGSYIKMTPTATSLIQFPIPASNKPSQ